MKIIQKVFNFYIDASIHVALAVYALLRITEAYFKLPYNENLNYFIFFGSITAYNFVKYASIAKLYHRRLTQNLKLIQLFSLVCFLAMLLYATKLSTTTLLCFVPFGVLTLLYVVPIFKGLTQNLRHVPSLKIIVIALVWAGVTVLLPIIDMQKPIDVNIILMCIQRFLFVIVLTLPFDIRDYKFDSKHLQTIPQKIGIAQTKKLGFVLLALTLAIEFYLAPIPMFRTVYLIIFIVLLVLLQRANQEQNKYYSSFFVEAIPILWWILLEIF